MQGRGGPGCPDFSGIKLLSIAGGITVKFLGGDFAICVKILENYKRKETKVKPLTQVF